MTICNMTIEGGGRAGMIAPDETTFEWVQGRPARPRTSTRRSSAGASCRPTTAPSFDTEVEIDAADLSPMVTWGTNPGMVVEVTDSVPDPAAMESPGRPRERPSARSPTWRWSRARR